MARWAVPALFLTVLTTLSCRDSQEPLDPAAQLLVGPLPGTLAVGDSLQLEVRILDAQGDTLRHRIVAWASSDPGVARVSAKGLVAVVGPGRAEISAVSEAAAGSVTVEGVAPFHPVALSLGPAQTCATDSAGASWCWGYNFSGALGLGVIHGTFLLPTRQQVGPITGLELGVQHGCTLAGGGVISCWGSNYYGEVGDSTTQPRLLPVPVKGAGGYNAIAAGYWSSCALRGGAWICWGSLTNTRLPIQVSAGPFTAVSMGNSHACTLAPDGGAFCFGGNFNGQLGDGGGGYQGAPVAVAGGHHFAQLELGDDHSCAVDSLGGAWCWGRNDGGQLGDGTRQDRSIPVAVPGLPALQQVTAGGAHTCGLATDGQAWCWGMNFSGSLGDGTTQDRLQPVPGGGTLRFTRLVAGGGHTCGIATTGRLHCWGFNDMGQVGDGSITTRLSPVLVHAR